MEANRSLLIFSAHFNLKKERLKKYIFFKLFHNSIHVLLSGKIKKGMQNTKRIVAGFEL